VTQQGLLIGLPGSGKTTFVAALWHVIASQDVEGALALQILEAPVDHLNTLRSRWLRLEETHRTSSNAEDITPIHVTQGEEGATATIVIPDLAGESIQQDLIDRKWETTFAEYVCGSTGVLLFVHPERVDDSWAITDAIEIAGEEPQVEQSAGEESDSTEWHPAGVPTQVKLVDLIQLVADRIKRQRFRVAVVVSAWDLIDDQESPSAWLAKELPLLSQFLLSASRRLESRVYGVSAQGGELLKDGDRLKAVIKASERIQVVHDNSSVSHDITAPIRWALNVDEEEN